MYLYKASGSYIGRADININNLVVSYDNNGTFALKVEHLSYKTKDTES